MKAIAILWSSNVVISAIFFIFPPSTNKLLLFSYVLIPKAFKLCIIARSLSHSLYFNSSTLLKTVVPFAKAAITAKIGISSIIDGIIFDSTSIALRLDDLKVKSPTFSPL